MFSILDITMFILLDNRNHTHRIQPDIIFFFFFTVPNTQLFAHKGLNYVLEFNEILEMFGDSKQFAVVDRI